MHTTDATGKILLIKSLRPFVWVSKLYGALPLQFKETEVKISICGLIYGVLLILFVGFVGAVNYFILEYEEGFYIRVIQAFNLLSCVFAIATFLSYTIQIRNIRKLYEIILTHFSRLNNFNNEPFRKKIFLLTTSEILFFLLINFIYHLIRLLFTRDDDDGDDYGEDAVIAYVFISTRTFTEHFVLFIITLFNLQFANLILLLSNLFKLANNDLKIYLKNSKTFIKREESEENTKKAMAFIDTRDGDLSKLIDFHDDIYSLCGHANKYFGLSLLLSSILTLITMLVSLYFLVGKSFFNYDFKIFSFQFGYSVINLWFILYCCESAVMETKETGILVHRLMAKTKDERLQEQLQKFSLQLLHSKLKFTACGLFPLNYSLMYSISVLVTTYLVILIQFHEENLKSLEKSHCDPETLTDEPPLSNE